MRNGSKAAETRKRGGEKAASRLGMLETTTGVTCQRHRGRRAGRGAAGKRCDEPSRFRTINYPDITSPVAEDSVGKGQPSGSRKDQLAMHVTAPSWPSQCPAHPQSSFTFSLSPFSTAPLSSVMVCYR
ncbi:hypothetical protein EYF80_018808 [Liparis tanakae]|uniref:Uncharacterized protein n=1 Tax=Liparis tanakae TaxID=230148 RepID=A0A4Z2I173_9TELE|nr:hypothetical protein EYF80_018808 [Liparis tanakae]